MVRSYLVTEDELASAHIDPTDGHLKFIRGDGVVIDAGEMGGQGGATVQVGGAKPASGLWLDTQPTVMITAAAPTFNDLPGTASDSVTIPTSPHVSYQLDGVTKAAGVYPASGTVTVLPIAAAGYTLTNPAGWEWEFSTLVPDVDPPLPPSNLWASFATTQASVSWDASSSTDVTQYRVSGNGGSSWKTFGNVRSGWVDGLTPGSSVTILVQAGDDAGNWSTSASVSGTTPATQSAFRDRVLALGVDDYWTLDESSYPPGNPVKARNLGRARHVVGSITGTPGTGASLGDGSVSLQGSISVSNVLSGATAWSVMGIVNVDSTAGLAGGWTNAQYNVQANGTLLIGVNNTNLSPSTPPSVTGRHFLALTYDGSTAVAYWDGDVIGSKAIAGFTMPNAGFSLSAGSVQSYVLHRGVITGADIALLATDLGL